jgi:hypothetical protein
VLGGFGVHYSNGRAGKAVLEMPTVFYAVEGASLADNVKVAAVCKNKPRELSNFEKI